MASFNFDDKSVLENLPPTKELIKHYRKRVGTFEDERNELLRRIDDCKLQHREKHKIEHELARREGEVRELQKALSDAHNCLFEERERLLELQKENDELKLREVEDRGKINNLLSLTQPVDDEITYSRNTKPETVGTVELEAGAEGAVRGGLWAQPGAAHTETLLLQVRSLEAQLSEHKKFASERIAALLEDRRIREQEEDTHRLHYEGERYDLQDKLKNTEDLLYRATKDVLKMRQDKQEAETRAAEAGSAIKTAHEGLTRKFQSEQAKLAKKITKRYEDRLRSYKEKLEESMTTMVNMEAAHGALKMNYEKRISELEGSLQTLRKKHKKLEYRRALDLAGFNSDVTQLRQQMTSVDRNLHRMRLIERLEDHQRLDYLLEFLEPPKQIGVGGRKKSSKKAKSKAGPYDVPKTTDLLIDVDKVREDLQNIADRILAVDAEED
ncbi:hypothetical protein HOP50_02g11520 [Chloropicon primus]|uniref:Uncharacterized protein n=1 Tax=Chloropicon primus TaxID=1764295 RepID=A0A5B8MDZ0_9CHLO|nr:hypothetical protein A3770_02p11670 [Chloropicon primus]UPQ97857.1 hypothetical protein HOP50_02g11520 [Chloropicon primus]|eukprot:QDZ18649.1 hypothetical protein A3770_02p11670 [Chloropicon primus]